MPEQDERWLLETWIRCFEEAVQALTGERPRLSAGEPGAPEEPTWWRRERLSHPENATVWIGAAPEVIVALGRRVLEAAGAEQADDEQARSTYAELVEQAMGMLAAALETRLGREIRRAGSEEGDGARPAEGIPLTAHLAGQAPYRMWVAFDVVLPAESDADPPAAKEAGESRAQPIDLLLDVELPVSISFGRTHLPLKEVLKLTSGSIVELNRAVSDPVEVIVNNCVIARGEVVVVEGNYGVRIQEIVSRQQRLRTLN
jgi:flagellar motor switch protein FliN/FliY